MVSVLLELTIMSNIQEDIFVLLSTSGKRYYPSSGN